MGISEPSQIMTIDNIELKYRILWSNGDLTAIGSKLTKLLREDSFKVKVHKTRRAGDFQYKDIEFSKYDRSSCEQRYELKLKLGIDTRVICFATLKYGTSVDRYVGYSKMPLQRLRDLVGLEKKIEDACKP